MIFVYDITVYIGYFLILIIFLTIAIILGNRPAGWTMYGIGAVVQFLSLLGVYKSYQGYPYFGYGYEEKFTPYVLIYIFLLIISCIAIAIHRPKSKKDTDDITTENNSTYEDPQLTEEQRKRQEKSDIRQLLVLIVIFAIVGIISFLYSYFSLVE